MTDVEKAMEYFLESRGRAIDTWAREHYVDRVSSEHIKMCDIAISALRELSDNQCDNCACDLLDRRDVVINALKGKEGMNKDLQDETPCLFKFTLKFAFKIRIDYRERAYKETHVTVFASDAKNAVEKAQKLLWKGAYEMEVLAINIEEIQGMTEGVKLLKARLAKSQSRTDANVKEKDVPHICINCLHSIYNSGEVCNAAYFTSDNPGCLNWEWCGTQREPHS